MAIYIMAGQSGQALGPLLAAFVAVRAGLPWFALTSSRHYSCHWPWYASSRGTGRVAQRSGVSAGLRDALRQNLGGLARLMGLVMSRAPLLHCMLALLSFMFHARGAPATAGAAAITAMIFSGAVGGMVGGCLSDPCGRRLVLFVSFALASPLFLAAIMSRGSATIIFLALGGAALLGSSSLVTVEAQSLLPAHASMAAGLMLGVGMGVGGFLVGPVSALAQVFGILPVLTVVSLLPLPGSILSLSLTQTAPSPSGRSGGRGRR